MREVEILSAADASVDQNSVPYQLGDLFNYSVQATFSSATLNGDLQLQAANDESNWHDITGGFQSIVNGTTHLFNVMNAGYKYVRCTWANTSGTGTITMKVIVKEPLNRF